MRVLSFMRGSAHAFWNSITDLPAFLVEEDRRTVAVVAFMLLLVAIVSLPLVVSVIALLALVAAGYYAFSVLPARKSFEKRCHQAEKTAKAAR